MALAYLGLPADYEPSPQKPIDFLRLHIQNLPPHILASFSNTTSPKQRSQIPIIRNRRLQYTNSHPQELSLASAKRTWPHLWKGAAPIRTDLGNDESQWVQSNFLEGSTKHVGKLGALLGGYEEEREAERSRMLRRERASQRFIPEEDSDSDDDMDEDAAVVEPEETAQEAEVSFMRLVCEQFIYGLLDDINYDKVDWDESLDVDYGNDAEERWFDEEDEGE